MPANVESMFFTGDAPWHRLGTPVTEALDAAAAIRAAGLDWDVEMQEVYTREGLAIAEWRVVRRCTDQAILGMVTETYRPIQNREAFAFADALLGMGARFETAGSLAGGGRVWLMARLPEAYHVLDDPATVYLTLTNGHDGKHAFQAIISPVRVVCENTLNLAIRSARRSWSVVHVGDPAARLEAARQALDLTAGYLKALNAKAEQFAAQRISGGEWNDLVDQVLVPRESARETERRRALRETIRGGMWAEDVLPYAETAWGAVQAVSWAVSHRVPANAERALVDFLDGDDLMRKLLNHLEEREPVPV